ncbi:MAG: hypothetical protein K0S08_1712 [Gammaproteobacteria bacterium]|jgi:hypothetical protein|nr:hypothetical protein [Gammaproteobacteria bacterium]
MLFTISGQSIPNVASEEAISELEKGSIIFLPELNFPFTPEEEILYADKLLSNRKNVSYDVRTDEIHGIQAHAIVAKRMMTRYARFAQKLVENLFPNYVSHLQIARTSFRPAEIEGRKPASYRKDDTRLHVDAFPATPNQGKRLLRVFTNVNPNGKPRVWRVGEPFQNLAQTFQAKLILPPAYKKYLLRCFGITKSLRSDYDELMLQLHDKMKADLNYQQHVQQTQLVLPAGATWIVFTDQVSHAALSGQYCLEQTFLLPVEAMSSSQRSPLKILEKLFNQRLV